MPFVGSGSSPSGDTGLSIGFGLPNVVIVPRETVVTGAQYRYRGEALTAAVQSILDRKIADGTDVDVTETKKSFQHERGGFYFALAVTLLCVCWSGVRAESHEHQQQIISYNGELIERDMLQVRNIEFGLGTRSFSDQVNPATSALLNLGVPSLVHFDDDRRRLASVFKRRVGAELDFYGLVGSNGLEDEFHYDSEDWSASVVLRIPVTILDVYGKFGAIHRGNYDSGLNSSRRWIGSEQQGIRPWSRTEGFASIGAELNLGFFNLFGEYMRIDSEAETEVDTFSTGIKFRF